MTDTMSRALQAAGETGLTAQPQIDAAVLDLVERSMRPPRRHHVSRLLLIGAAVPAAALALGGAAVTVDSSLNPDVIIPVAYTTDTGLEFSCTIYIEGGSVLSPGSTVVGHELAARDWDGIGQRIYERALALSAALDGTTSLSASDRDYWAWSSAETQLTVLTVPAAQLPEGEHAVVVSDCTGRLH